jgi:Putative amidoligase enzyme
VPHELESRVGFEIELLAPRGATRADLAHAVAAAVGGGVALAFHRDSEPSAVPGMGAFRHLTRGFDVLDAAGRPVCSVVDDVTIVADLDIRAAPVPGWHRIVTDDPRLLNLLAQVCDPAAPVDQVLAPVAALFGTEVTCTQRSIYSSIYKVSDRDGASIAMAAPLPGERHRPAEIVTTPLEHDHGSTLDRILRPAGELGFTVPVEAAVHLHFDAAPFRTPRAFANVVELFSMWGEPLRALVGTNPACRRLGPPPPALAELAGTLRDLGSWDDVRNAVTGIELTKYCDVNLLHVIREPMIKDTLEVRILPGAADAAQIMSQAALVEGLLQRCLAGDPFPEPAGSVRHDLRTLARWGRKEW